MIMPKLRLVGGTEVVKKIGSSTPRTFNEELIVWPPPFAHLAMKEEINDIKIALTDVEYFFDSYIAGELRKLEEHHISIGFTLLTLLLKFSSIVIELNEVITEKMKTTIINKHSCIALQLSSISLTKAVCFAIRMHDVLLISELISTANWQLTIAVNL